MQINIEKMWKCWYDDCTVEFSIKCLKGTLFFKKKELIKLSQTEVCFLNSTPAKNTSVEV